MIGSISGGPAAALAAYQQHGIHLDSQTESVSGARQPGDHIQISGDGMHMLNALRNDAVIEVPRLPQLGAEDQKALDKLEKRLDAIFDKAKGGALSDVQSKEVDALLGRIDKLLGKYPTLFDLVPVDGHGNEADTFGGFLSADQAKKVDALFKELDKAFETAGGKPLTEEAQKKVDALYEKIDKIFMAAEDAMTAPRLSEADRARVEKLYKELDKIIRTDADEPATYSRSLSEADQKKAAALFKKLGGIFGVEGSMKQILTEKNEEISKIFADLDTLYGAKSLSAKQEARIDKILEQIDSIFSKTESGDATET